MSGDNTFDLGRVTPPSSVEETSVIIEKIIFSSPEPSSVEETTVTIPEPKTSIIIERVTPPSNYDLETVTDPTPMITDPPSNYDQPSTSYIGVPQTDETSQSSKPTDLCQGELTIKTPAFKYRGAVLLKAMVKTQQSNFVKDEDFIKVKEVEETHTRNNTINVRPLLEMIEHIFNFSHLPTSLGNTLEDWKTTIITEELSQCIDRISCEIQRIQCAKGVDGLPLFKLLSNYRWDAKLVLILSSFAIGYGKIWHFAQIYLSNSLAKLVAISKRVPMLIERSSDYAPNQYYDIITKVIKAMLDITRLIVKFYEFSLLDVSSDQPLKVDPIMNVIPAAAYQTVKGVIICVERIMNLLPAHDYGYSSSMGWDPLLNVAQNLESITDYLKKEMDNLGRIINKRFEDKVFEIIIHTLYVAVHVDNMRVLSTLISVKDPEPLINCTTKRPASLEFLKHKNVLLLISDLDMLVDEVSVLESIYQKIMHHNYEVVWIPVVDKSAESNALILAKFNKLKLNMKWYSLREPFMIDCPVIKFFREIWGFQAKPIMVVLDPQGKVLSTNAIFMMLIWGYKAFPFTSIKERELWHEETWKLELLVGEIDSTVLEWIMDKKYIFLFGGEDEKLIHEFTKEVKRISNKIGINNLEMVYAGNSLEKEKIKDMMNMINKDKLTHCWNEYMVWLFWTRLESMLLSRFHIDIESTKTLRTREAKHFFETRVELTHADKDLMIQKIMKLTSFGRGGGWAVLAQGSQVLPPTHLNTVVHVLSNYRDWKNHIESESFLTMFWERLKKRQADELRTSYIRVEFPTTYGMLPKGIECPDCHHLMMKHNSFICCHDFDTTHAESHESQN